MNIQNVLQKINKGDYKFFLDLTEEEVKELPPYVLGLWLRGAEYNHAEHTIMTEMYFNRNLFHLHRHPKLLYCLAVAGNCGMDNTRYQFKKDQKEDGSKDIKLIMREFTCNEGTAKMYKNFLDENDIKELETKYKEVDA